MPQNNYQSYNADLLDRKKRERDRLEEEAEMQRRNIYIQDLIQRSEYQNEDFDPSNVMTTPYRQGEMPTQEMNSRQEQEKAQVRDRNRNRQTEARKQWALGLLQSPDSADQTTGRSMLEDIQKLREPKIVTVGGQNRRSRQSGYMEDGRFIPIGSQYFVTGDIGNPGFLTEDEKREQKLPINTAYRRNAKGDVSKIDAHSQYQVDSAKAALAMMQASKEADSILARKDFDPSSILENISQMGLPDIIEKFTQTKDGRAYMNAVKRWSRAKNRLESGAAISDDEFLQEFINHFPTLLDGPPGSELWEMKKRARGLAEEALAVSSGGFFEDNFRELIVDSKEGETGVVTQLDNFDDMPPGARRME